MLYYFVFLEIFYRNIKKLIHTELIRGTIQQRHALWDFYL